MNESKRQSIILFIQKITEKGELDSVLSSEEQEQLAKCGLVQGTDGDLRDNAPSGLWFGVATDYDRMHVSVHLKSAVSNALVPPYRFHLMVCDDPVGVNHSQVVCRPCQGLGMLYPACKDCAGRGHYVRVETERVNCDRCKGAPDFEPGYGSCGKCGGTGKMEIDHHHHAGQCQTCGGKGSIPKDCPDCDGNGNGSFDTERKLRKNAYRNKCAIWLVAGLLLTYFVASAFNSP